MGVYASFEDVADRYEGELPEDREAWIEARIDDVEAELVGLVPSLAGDSVLESDPARAARVRRLICEKVLALFRNPDGAMAVSNTAGQFAQTRTLSRAPLGSWLSFTDQELFRIGYTRLSSAGSVKLRAYYYEPGDDLPSV